MDQGFSSFFHPFLLARAGAAACSSLWSRGDFCHKYCTALSRERQHQGETHSLAASPGLPFGLGSAEAFWWVSDDFCPAVKDRGDSATGLCVCPLHPEIFSVPCVDLMTEQEY